MALPETERETCSQLDDDEFEMYRDHPFEDELPAPDGNFYPRHSKLRPAGATDVLLVRDSGRTADFSGWPLR